MRKVVMLFAAAAASLVLAAPGNAEPHPNSCATPTVRTDNASYIGLCTQGGYAEASSADGGYVLLDGAAGNPDPGDGYIVVGPKGVGCKSSGDWNAGDARTCP